MRFASLIARQETESTGVDPASVQEGGEQGRGMFQFESPYYVKAGTIPPNSVETAVNRLKNFYRVSGLVAPEWVRGLTGKIDPAMLSAEQQYMLFFADKMPTKNAVNPVTKKKELQFGTSPLAKINEKDFNPVDWWAKYHKRATPSPSDTTRFNRILTNYNSTNPDTTQQAAVQPQQVSYMSEQELMGTPQYLNRFGGYTSIT
jgi:hypothetical protein